MDTELEDLGELIKAIRNRCDIWLLLQESKEIERIKHLYPTLLEDLYTDAQTILDEYCRVKDD